MIQIFTNQSLSIINIFFPCDTSCQRSDTITLSGNEIFFNPSTIEYNYNIFVLEMQYFRKYSNIDIRVAQKTRKAMKYFEDTWRVAF